MKKKIRYEDLTLEMKKDIFLKLTSNEESVQATQKRYNITEKTMNRICVYFIFEHIHETDDGIIDITADTIIDINGNIQDHEKN